MPIATDVISQHDAPECPLVGRRIYLLSENDLAMLGDGDQAFRTCPEGGGKVNIFVQGKDGLFTYRYKCSCGLYTIEN